MLSGLLLDVTNIFLTMGLPSIDESLDKLLVAMEAFPKSAVLGDTLSQSLPFSVILWLMPVSSVCAWLCVSAPMSVG